MTMHRLLVYGTLMTGEPNHHRLRGASLVGETLTTRGYTLYDLGPFPALVVGGHGNVPGELYEVDDETLAALDVLEGHPRFYQRAVVVLDDRTYAEAYVLTKDKVQGWPRIRSGSWRVHREDFLRCRS
jgi:gamma-glutamylaminecyclotransferase